MVIGPDDTPFEDGTFKLVLQFTEKYPNEPPKVKFQTNMFHPNIYADGQLCLDILARKWSPNFVHTKGQLISKAYFLVLI